MNSEDYLLHKMEQWAAREESFVALIRHALAECGGWREAITELEDFCSEPVRLKNMTAAADQLDAWRKRAMVLLKQLGYEVKQRGVK